MVTGGVHPQSAHVVDGVWPVSQLCKPERQNTPKRPHHLHYVMQTTADFSWDYLVLIGRHPRGDWISHPRVSGEPSELFTTLHGTCTRCVVADRRKEERVTLALTLMIMYHILRQHMACH